MNLVEKLRQEAARRPQQAAIIDAGGVLSYADLVLRTGAYASGLAERGIGAGDRVLVMLSMGRDCYTALFACWQRGAVACFIDPGAGPDHLRHCVRRLRPQAFVAGPLGQALRWQHPCLGRIPRVLGMGAPWCARPLRRRSSRGPKPAVVADSHPAIITATSGSTGLPKLAVRSHGFLDRQQQVLRRHLDIAPGSCDLATLLVFALVDLAAGATCVVADADLRRVGQVAARPVLSQIHRHRVRSIVASPAFFERICPENTVDHLAWIATGGAPLVPDALQRFADWAPEARVEGVYGSTEAEPIATMDAAAISAEDRQASVSGAGLLAGHPVPDIHCTLRDLSAGSAGWHPATADFGEILVAGSHVLTGYLDGAGDRERKIHHGGRIWHRTGDCGRFDAQGRLWLLGRCDAVLRHRDQYLFPFAVEVAARGRSGGARCALVDAGTGPCLVVEGPAEPLRPWAASLGIDQVCTHPIPLDRRHNAKVDYPALIRSLQEQPHGH